MVYRLLCALLFATPVPAFAADWYTGAKPQSANDDWIVSVDASTDITTQSSYFGDVLVTGAPVGTLAESGLRLRGEGIGGIYSYYSVADKQTIRGRQVGGAALIGYEWVSSSLVYSAYVGADVRSNVLSYADPANPAVGTNFGFKGQFELFAKPSLRTMVAVNGSYATNDAAYFARARGGYLIGPDLYVGPEFVALGDSFFNQERVGAHISGLGLGPLHFAFAAGFLYDRVRGNGGYTTVDARVGF